MKTKQVNRHKQATQPRQVNKPKQVVQTEQANKPKQIIQTKQANMPKQSNLPNQATQAKQVNKPKQQTQQTKQIDKSKGINEPQRTSSINPNQFNKSKQVVKSRQQQTKTPPKKGNYAFIDFHNLFITLAKIGWYIDYKKFRIYLEEKYKTKKAYIFMGYIPKNQELYRELQDKGYTLMFKPVLETKDGKTKGNCDADLVLRVMIDLNDFDKAILVSGDGDFYCLVNHLLSLEKLERVLAPASRSTSTLMKKSAGKNITFMDGLRNKLEYKKRTQ